MKDSLEEMLRQTLTPSEEPDACLNQNIVNSVRKSQAEANETEMEVSMRKSWVKKELAVALSTAVAVLVGSLSTYAAWKYLKPEQAAVEMGDDKLADAFRGADAVSMDESQSYGGYTVTLLGMTSGKNLSKYEMESDGEFLEDRTYAVLAIEKEDGTRMAKSDRMSDLSDEDSEFLVSPLIQGEDPRFTNIFKMNGGSSSFLEDGILYRVIDCDNLEVFAGRGVYLSVTHSTFFESDAYYFDKESGEITRNKEYNGLNALFQLPFDTSKTDEKAAEEQLRKWDEEADAPDESEEESDADKGSREWDEKRLKEEAKILPKTVETLTPDKDGYIYTKKWSYKGLTSGRETLLATGPDGLFDESETGLKVSMITQGSNEKSFIETCTKNEDGTITVAVYLEK